MTQGVGLVITAQSNTTTVRCTSMDINIVRDQQVMHLQQFQAQTRNTHANCNVAAARACMAFTHVQRRTCIQEHMEFQSLQGRAQTALGLGPAEEQTHCRLLHGNSP